ncbi:hypothetical protein D6D28_04322 [Aureobasidium pullulans]|uniref:Magnesium transporter n=1 Tax=Aureobasidium pullulans TaxID=5580 RepID=A0A4S8SLR1_AURPU|nr:hypothetical protein D6D28_04322 [Aureobasidium pullulans]
MTKGGNATFDSKFDDDEEEEEVEVQQETRLPNQNTRSRHTSLFDSWFSQAFAVCPSSSSFTNSGRPLSPYTRNLVMALVSSALNIFGAVLLAHAAHEHSTLATLAGGVPVSPVHSYIMPQIDLPLDITLETLTAVLLLCVGIVIGSPELKPIQWRVWAGKLEKEKTSKTQSINGDPLGPRGNPYAALEQRQGFLDIRAQRKDFADWVKSGSSKK